MPNCRKVSVQLHHLQSTPAINRGGWLGPRLGTLPRVSAKAPFVQETRCALGPVRTGAEYLAPHPPWSEPRTDQPVASRYTVWAIPAAIIQRSNNVSAALIVQYNNHVSAALIVQHSNHVSVALTVQYSNHISAALMYSNHVSAALIVQYSNHVIMLHL